MGRTRHSLESPTWGQSPAFQPLFSPAWFVPEVTCIYSLRVHTCRVCALTAASFSLFPLLPDLWWCSDVWTPATPKAAAALLDWGPHGTSQAPQVQPWAGCLMCGLSYAGACVFSRPLCGASAAARAGPRDWRCDVTKASQPSQCS